MVVLQKTQKALHKQKDLSEKWCSFLAVDCEARRTHAIDARRKETNKGVDIGTLHKIS